MLTFNLYLQKIINSIQRYITFCVIFKSLFRLFLNVFKLGGLDDYKSDKYTDEANQERYLFNKNLTFKSIDYFYNLTLIFSIGVSRNIRNTFSFCIKNQQLNNNFYIFNNNLGLFSNKQLYLYGLKSI